MSWFVHGANGVVVQKHVGELKQELIDVRTVMSKLRDVTSFHLVPDLVTKRHTNFDKQILLSNGLNKSLF